MTMVPSCQIATSTRLLAISTDDPGSGISAFEKRYMKGNSGRVLTKTTFGGDWKLGGFENCGNVSYLFSAEGSEMVNLVKGPTGKSLISESSLLAATREFYQSPDFSPSNEEKTMKLGTAYVFVCLCIVL